MNSAAVNIVYEFKRKSSVRRSPVFHFLLLFYSQTTYIYYVYDEADNYDNFITCLASIYHLFTKNSLKNFVLVFSVFCL